MKIKSVPVETTFNIDIKEVKERKKLTDEEILAMQSASTRAIITRSKEKDAEAQNRVVSTVGQTTLASMNDKRGLDALVAKSDIDPTQAVIVEEMRRKGHRNNQQIATNVWVNDQNVKDKPLSSVSEESKERAIDAFIYTPPAPLTESQKSNLVELERIAELSKLPQEQIHEKPKKLAGKLMHWFWKNNIPLWKLTNKEFSLDVADELNEGKK